MRFNIAVLACLLGLSAAACPSAGCTAPQTCQRNSCKACPDNAKYYQDGVCVATCPIYLSADSKTCLTACAKYTNAAGKQCVDDCVSTKFVSENKCLDVCPAGFKKIPGQNGDPGSCVECTMGFTLSPDKLSCECKKLLDGSQCVASCPGNKYTSADGKSCLDACPKYTDATGKLCVDSCATTKFVFENKCLDACRAGLKKIPGQGGNPGSCVECTMGFTVSPNKLSCECTNLLDGSQCVASCPGKKIVPHSDAPSTCEDCPRGQVLVGTGQDTCGCASTDTWYNPTTYTCETCESPEAVRPTGCYCPDDKFVLADRTCVADCDNGEVTEQEGGGPKLCTPCKLGETLEGTSCTCGGFYDGDECKKCLGDQISDGENGCECPENNQWYNPSKTMCEACELPLIPGPSGCYCPDTAFLTTGEEPECLDTCEGVETAQETGPKLCRACDGDQIPDGRNGCKCPKDNQWYNTESTICQTCVLPRVAGATGCECPDTAFLTTGEEPGCLDTCEGVETAQETGPKLCRACDGDQIPDGRNGCKCPNDYQWYKAESGTCETCEAPLAASADGCHCPETAFESPEGNCLARCDNGAVESRANAPRLCKPCQPNASPNSDATKCVCNLGFFAKGPDCTANCPDGSKPRDGKCLPQCTKGVQKLCYGECKDIKTDNNNCGNCGNVCTDGKTCLDGKCKLPPCSARSPALEDCRGKCKDVTSDVRNCGACGNSCPSGASCTQGSCKCPQGTIDCSGKCKPVDDNCGWCGNRCSKGKTCVTGEAGPANCECPEGLNDCGNGKCVNFQDDPKNCGTCYKTCTLAKKVLARNADFWAVGSSATEEVQGHLEARAPLGTCVGGACQQPTW